MLLVAIGVIGLVYGLIMRSRAGRISDAPFVKTGEAAAKGTAAASPRGAISTEGNVTCPEPLVAPMSGKTCLYYEIKVTASWKDGDTTKEKELDHEKRAARFAVDDGTGPVWIDAREGGDFEPEEVKAETKATSLLGGITGQELMFGQYKVSTGMLSIGTRYHVEEKLLPALPRLYVCGKVGPGNEIAAPGWRALLITGKSRAEYLGHAMQSARIALIAAASLMGVGAVLTVVGAVTGIGNQEPARKTAAAADPGVTDTTAVASTNPGETAAPTTTAPKAGPKPAVKPTARPPARKK
jgi:hypothetical protein